MAEERKYTSYNELNRWVGMGRLTRDPEVRYTQGENSFAIARFTIAIDRRSREEGGATDYINIVAMRDLAERVEKYLRKGTKVAVEGRIQTGSYTNKDGQKVYTTEINAETFYFAESKGSSASAQSSVPAASSAGDGFMNIPDGIEEELPFN